MCFAFDREPVLCDVIDFSHYSSLSTAWRRSGETLSAVTECLQRLDERVVMVAVSGSLGRMEQLGHSDGDFIVLLNDEIALEARESFESVWCALEPLGLGRPKSTGIYATPSTRKELCKPESRGTIAEDVSVFGKRIQLLLDCQPVYGDGIFWEVIDSILGWYCPSDGFSERESRFKYLVDDLVRYFRSLSVMYRWEARDRPGYWRLRNVKLRHTRLMNYAGLLLLLGEADRRGEDALSWLKERISLTPLERVAEVFRENGGREFSQIAESYEYYLSRLGDPVFFTQLTDEDDSRLEAQPAYRELEINSERLLSALSRFLIQRETQWNRQFLSGLFF